MSTPELPPEHQDTPGQKLTLRRSKVARHVRKQFPRGTRVEATAIFSEPGTGRLGTVIHHIPGSSADGGRLAVLWDEPNPFGGGQWISRAMWAGGLLVVDPATGRGIVRPRYRRTLQEGEEQVSKPLSRRMVAALSRAYNSNDGIVLTTTATHIALQRRGYVEGIHITEAGREALKGVYLTKGASSQEGAQ